MSQSSQSLLFARDPQTNPRYPETISRYPKPTSTRYNYPNAFILLGILGISAVVGVLVFQHLKKTASSKPEPFDKCSKVSHIAIDKIETLIQLKTPMCMYVGASGDKGDPGAVVHASPGHPESMGIMKTAYCKAAENSSVPCYAIFDNAAVKFVGTLPAIMRMTSDGQIHKYQGAVTQPGLDAGLKTFMA